MTSSFKKDASLAPVRYRTPSPPLDYFEPLSPVHHSNSPAEALGFSLRWTHNHAGTHNGRKRPRISENRKSDDASRKGYPSNGAMDAFASIALATKPSGVCESTIVIDTPSIIAYHDGDRPAKRARSEKLPMPDWSRKGETAEIRPATSHAQSPESRRLEAELLLNFAQEAAKLTTPSPVLSKASLDHLRSAADVSLLPQNAHASSQPLERSHGLLETSMTVEDDDDDDDDGDVHGPPYSPLSEPAIDEQAAAFEVDAGHDSPARPDDPVKSIRLAPDNVELQVKGTGAPSSEISKQNDLESITKDAMNGLDSSEGYELRADQLEGRNLDPDHQRSINTPLEHPGVLAKPADPALDEMLQMMDEVFQVQQDDQIVNEAKLDENISPKESQDDPQEYVGNNGSHVSYGALGDKLGTVNEISMKEGFVTKPTPEVETTAGSSGNSINFFDTQPDTQPFLATTIAVCSACNFARNSIAIEKDDNSTSWISCDACKDWFHFACAGFKSEREVRSVDKFRCRKCKPVHGATTYVRKSSRAHSAIDYAGLHQGVIKTSDESPEHHYIKPIKDGTITFLPENFARMRPELVTAEYFEKGAGMKEPIVIPASLNPQPKRQASSDIGEGQPNDAPRPNPLDDSKAAEEWFSKHDEYESIPDQGQDVLDMVIPQGLTVRQVCELYGPEEKVEVIDVKSQNGENKKWNMRRWADYYENPNNKVVRNVISLEVSRSKLGRLIRRPKIVRDLDLQDSVWPEDLLAKGEYPRVQFYCLMSVADCFTDFHIDFGGSSVFYHILKGKKTFLFIPPKEKNLKKYEEWCMSPAQNWTFLGDQTKECYRVDLSEGDTMLIPSGWIHAVWTPEDSLVIGGNFLTRQNFAMQLRVAQIEKATGVARKFRYPGFQKLQWYTALRYLETDPLPKQVERILHSGKTFNREKPAYLDFDAWGENSRTGSENYHARYYSQSELEGLPDLVRYLLRTALIDIGSITDGISVDTRNAVKKSIPRGHGYGEPLELVKSFAAWVAWKRGDEPVPHWAYPDAVPETLAPDKLSAAAMKKLDREAALSAPRRQSARMQSQQEASQGVASTPKLGSSSTELSTPAGTKRLSDLSTPGQSDPKRPTTSGTGSAHRKTACESCRKRRRACKHKDQVAALTSTFQKSDAGSDVTSTATPLKAAAVDGSHATNPSSSSSAALAMNDTTVNVVQAETSRLQALNDEPASRSDDFASRLKNLSQDVLAGFTQAEQRPPAEPRASVDASLGNAAPVRPRTKACNDCRKSKRRCVHDVFGNEDPVKVAEQAIPRPHARKANIQKAGAKKPTPATKGENHTVSIRHESPSLNVPALEQQVRKPAPVANMIAQPSALSNCMPTMSSLPTAPLQASAELALDPALFDNDLSNFLPSKRIAVSVERELSLAHDSASSPSGIPNVPEPLDQAWQINPTCPAQNHKVNMVPLETRGSYDQPASSLVSPPASLNDDAGHSPSAANEDWTPFISSSRQSSSQPKQALAQLQQRYTPESGPMRRTSSSSYGENHTVKTITSSIAATTVTDTPPSGQRPSHKRLSSEIRADEESLRLIKELQAQEHGLRRRGKA